MICPHRRRGHGRWRVDLRPPLSAARFGVIMTLELDDGCRLRGAAQFLRRLILLGLATKISGDETCRSRDCSWRSPPRAQRFAPPLPKPPRLLRGGGRATSLGWLTRWAPPPGSVARKH